MFEPWIQPLIAEFGYQERFDTAMQWFNQWGVWVVFIAGFSPIPYKLFTVGAGFLQMAFLPFFIVSTIGRGLRFFFSCRFNQVGRCGNGDKVATVG
jgi:membrane protein YqaA with SNARE-associated domain